MRGEFYDLWLLPCFDTEPECPATRAKYSEPISTRSSVFRKLDRTDTKPSAMAKVIFPSPRGRYYFVFDSVSRMSRNAEEGIGLYFELYNRNINLVFLKEPYVNTSTYRDDLSSKKVERVGDETDIILIAIEDYLKALVTKQIRLAFQMSQSEVDQLRERTREGMLTAKLNRKQIGQVKDSKLKVKKAMRAKPLIKKHAREFGGTLNNKELMQLVGVSRNTLYKYKSEIRESNDAV